MHRLNGDLIILGAGGKMGPSLVRRAKRANPGLKVIAVARFSEPGLEEALQRERIETIRAELTDRKQVDALPDAPNVIFMAGRKFGSTGNEPLTWAVNAWAPGLAAERYSSSKIVAFSTGNVYPLVPVDSGGATEETLPAPVGEYAQSALARERIFQYFSNLRGTPTTLLRLNYAIDLRYGVLLDIGLKIFERRPIDLAMGYVNVLWQGDANSACLRSFEHASSPAQILNVTGDRTLAVRWIAEKFGAYFGVEPIFEGHERATALLNNASAAVRIFGPWSYSPEEMIILVAQWIGVGGRVLGKPTHFEARDGAY